MVVIRPRKFFSDDMTIVSQITDHHTHPILYVLMRYINHTRHIAHRMLLNPPLHFLSSSAKNPKVRACIERIEDTGEA